MAAGRLDFRSQRRRGTAVAGRALLALGMLCLLPQAAAGVQETAPESPASASGATAEESAATAPEPSAAERRPVDLIPLMRMQGDLSQLYALADRGSQLTGQSDWMGKSIVFDALRQPPMNRIRENLRNGQTSICYEVFATLPADGDTDSDIGVLATVACSHAVFLEIIGVELSAEPDAEGFILQDGVSLLLTDDFCSVLACEGEVRDARERLAEAVARARRNPARRPMEVIVEPQQIRSSLRATWLEAVLAGLYSSTQQRDGEELLSYRSREMYGQSMVQLLDLLFHQLRRITWALETAPTGEVSWALELEAVSGSALAGWIQRQDALRCDVLDSLHPDHSMFLSVCLATPEVIREKLPLLGAALGAALIKADLLRPASAAQLEQTVQALADRGVLELLVQAVPDSPQSLMVFASLPLPGAADLAGTTLELVSAIENSRLQVLAGDIDTWPVHLHENVRNLSFAELQGEPRGIGSDLQLVATDRQFVLHFTPPASRDRLAPFIRREFQPDERGTRYRRCGLAAHVSVRQWLDLLDVGEEQRRLYFGERLQQPGAADRVTATLETGGERLVLRIAFEDDVLVPGLVGFFNAFVMLVEAGSELF